MVGETSKQGRKPNLKNLTIIGLVCVIVAGGLMWLNNEATESHSKEIQKINQTAYSDGYQDGVMIGQISIFERAYSGGAATFTANDGNATVFSPQGCINYCNTLIQNGGNT